MPGMPGNSLAAPGPKEGVAEFTGVCVDEIGGGAVALERRVKGFTAPAVPVVAEGLTGRTNGADAALGPLVAPGIAVGASTVGPAPGEAVKGEAVKGVAALGLATAGGGT